MQVTLRRQTADGPWQCESCSCDCTCRRRQRCREPGDVRCRLAGERPAVVLLAIPEVRPGRPKIRSSTASRAALRRTRGLDSVRDRFGMRQFEVGPGGGYCSTAGRISSAAWATTRSRSSPGPSHPTRRSIAIGSPDQALRVQRGAIPFSHADQGVLRGGRRGRRPGDVRRGDLPEAQGGDPALEEAGRPHRQRRTAIIPPGICGVRATSSSSARVEAPTASGWTTSFTPTPRSRGSTRREFFIASDGAEVLPGGHHYPAGEIRCRRRPAPEHPVDGLIDEVAYFKRALSDAEIVKMAHRAARPLTPRRPRLGPVGLLAAGRSPPRRQIDSSGHGHGVHDATTKAGDLNEPAPRAEPYLGRVHPHRPPRRA